MKKYYSLLLVFLCVSFAQIAHAQGFRVPKDYKLESKEDYQKYEKDIIKCVNWLEKNHPDQDDDDYKNATRFMMEWVTGCNYIHFQENVRIESVFSDIPELKVYYIGGWARYALQNKEGDMGTFKLRCSMAGIHCALNVYKKISSKHKITDLEDLQKITDDGKLGDWVNARMK